MSTSAEMPAFGGTLQDVYIQPLCRHDLFDVLCL